MCLVLVPLSNNCAIKHEKVTLNVTLIRNLCEFEDLPYSNVNILAKTSAVSHKVK